METPGQERSFRNVDARQGYVTVPDTAENERRFWRSQQPLTTLQEIGLSLFAAFVFGTLAVMIWAISEGPDWSSKIVSGASFLIWGVVIFGPLFALLAWATHRALKNNQKTDRSG
jgi:sterol desaturase/sphingolipid hydroxylase (fatty acid hydroxylase superfamily)